MLPQPKDSCMHIALQCALLLLMLNVKLLSRLLSVSVDPNLMINVLAHVFTQPKSLKLVRSPQK